MPSLITILHKNVPRTWRRLFRSLVNADGSDSQPQTTKGALSELDEALRRQPREPLFHLYRGIIRAAMADKAEPLPTFRKPID